MSPIGGVTARAQEPVLLADQADGMIDVEGVTRVEVVGIDGTLTLRAGQAGKLRFACRSLDKRREERPVSLWEVDSTMRLAFSEKLAPQRLLLEVTLPPGVAAVVVTRDSKLTVNAVQGAVDVTGTAIDFGGRGLGGDVDLEIVGGSVTLIGAAGNVNVRGRDLPTKLTQVGGDVDANLVGGRLEMLEVQGGLALELENVDVVGDLIGGEIDARATGGTLTLSQARRGGVFELAATAFKLLASVGNYEIETDAQVEFENLDGTLTMRGYGGGLTGTGATGAVTYSGSEAEIRLGQLAGNSGISGDRLRVQVEGIKGDLTVNTSSSEVSVANAEGQVDLTNDFGDVTVAQVAKSVRVTSREGAVSITDLAGPADVKADGPVVTVHWSDTSNEADSSVENASGDVRLLFSPKGGGQLEAEASYGRIESSLQGVTVADDGTKASGIVNRLSSTNIRVVSGGDVYLAGAPESKPQASAPAAAPRQ